MTLDQNAINALIPLYMNKFIQRVDPVAEQNLDGSYKPLRDFRTKVSTLKFNNHVITDHLSAKRTYGHYMLDQSSKTKLFVLDVDLTKEGFVPTVPLNREDPTDEDYDQWVQSFVFTPDLRAVWHNRRLVPQRDYIKYQFRTLGGILADKIHSLLDIPTAVAYSGNKGIHVYGFTGITNADTAVAAAKMVLASTKIFEPLHGENFYTDSRREVIPLVDLEPDPAWVQNWTPKDFDPDMYSNLHIELFPKQTSISGDGLGNLVRLPLGRNLHAPKNPTFFVDLTSALTEFREVDPVFALTTDNPWQTPREAGY